jgi:hypothetical protein
MNVFGMASGTYVTHIYAVMERVADHLMLILIAIAAVRSKLLHRVIELLSEAVLRTRVWFKLLMLSVKGVQCFIWG